MTKDARHTRLELPLKGLHCASCSSRVEKALSGLPGIRSARVNLANATASLEIDEERVRLPDIVRAVRDAGYDVDSRETSLAVHGMHCASCTNRVENSLKAVRGVLDASVNPATGEARIRYIPGLTGWDAWKKAVSAAGDYTLSGNGILSDPGETQKSEYLKTKKKFWISAGLTLAIMIGSMPGMLPGFHPPAAWSSVFGIPLGVLTLAVMVFAGNEFYRGAWSLLKRRAADMNTLIAMGTGAAFLYSALALASPSLFAGPGAHPAVYFDTTAMIVTLVLLGRMMENRARSRTASAIQRLMDLRPKTARIVREGREIEIPAADVQVGDVLAVRPGEMIPVDGIIREGRSALNESLMTGESMPVEKGPGDRIWSGTLNADGAILFEAEGVGNETLLGRMIRLVREAQGSKAPIQKTADRVASVFVPAVAGIALLTLAVWLPFDQTKTLANFISVLIIACPCAMGLATPTAIMVATGRAAEQGILIRGGDVLETLHRVDTVLLDKTGTVTHGKPSVTDVIALNGSSGDEILALAAIGESLSEHPFGRAVITAAEDMGFPVPKPESFRAHHGLGVQARFADREILVGNEEWMRVNRIRTDAAVHHSRLLAGQGKTALYVASEGNIKGLIAVSDTVRKDAAETAALLKRMGIRVLMLTGDNRDTAKTVADSIGAEVMAEVLPDRKAQIVKSLKDRGSRVAMVGDGVNDAPAIAAADVGIAMSSGTDTAIETADITIHNDLSKLIQALRLSRKSMRIIRQNLFWAFIYNIIGIPVAAGVLYPFTGTLLNPVFAAAAMSLSSVSVVANSLRLRRFR
jgi:Cu+-exporting ATPase